ncbi:hypothetical protein D3C86_2050690 [compost metagenome]
MVADPVDHHDRDHLFDVYFFLNDFRNRKQLHAFLRVHLAHPVAGVIFFILVHVVKKRFEIVNTAADINVLVINISKHRVRKMADNVLIALQNAR